MKLVWTVPGSHESADGSGAHAAKCAIVGVLGEIPLLLYVGNNFFE
jgi:hypothetical protein